MFWKNLFLGDVRKKIIHQKLLFADTVFGFLLNFDFDFLQNIFPFILISFLLENRLLKVAINIKVASLKKTNSVFS